MCYSRGTQSLAGGAGAVHEQETRKNAGDSCGGHNATNLLVRFVILDAEVACSVKDKMKGWKVHGREKKEHSSVITKRFYEVTEENGDDERGEKLRLKNEHFIHEYMKANNN